MANNEWQITNLIKIINYFHLQSKEEEDSSFRLKSIIYNLDNLDDLISKFHQNKSSIQNFSNLGLILQLKTSILIKQIIMIKRCKILKRTSRQFSITN
ncbi:hypothetical protein pb186bvf_018955 [Paramecium bursaria]